MTKTIEPKGSRLFIRELLVQNRSTLFVPDECKETEYAIVFVGPEATLIPGTKVVPSLKKSLKVKIYGDTFIVTDESDLLAVVREVEDDNDS